MKGVGLRMAALVLTNAGAQRQQLLARYRCSEVGNRQTHVVYTVLVQAEAESIAIVEWCNEVLERIAGVVGQLGEESLGLLLGERAHCD